MAEVELPNDLGDGRLGFASEEEVDRFVDTLEKFERGWPAHTPAAIVLDASWSEQASWTGTLDGLGRCELPAEHPEAAGVLVIGEVVSLAEALSAAPATAVRAA